MTYKKKEVYRIYSIKDADLLKMTDRFVQNAKNDMPDLSGYGLQIDFIEETKVKKNAFANIPNDEELLGLAVEATEQKNEKVDGLKKQIKDIVVRAEIRYGKNSAQLKRFAASTLSQMTDSELCKCAKRVFRTAENLLEELKDNGVTKEKLNQMLEEANILDTLIDLQDERNRERDIQTELRIEAGNELFSCLQKIAMIGKAAYQSTNEAKYTNYLLGE